MKIPNRPPDTKKIFENSKRLGLIFHVSQQAANDGKYYHWDKLRHMKPPAGLSHEEWWLALKMTRSGLLNTLSLKDISGKLFHFGLPAPVPEDLHHIDQDASGNIAISEREITTPGMRDQYLIRSLIEEAITSSQLEGAATTRRVAREMIRSQRPPKDKSERMILNNYLAMREIQTLKDKPLSKELILELHRILTNQTLENPSAAGRFRQKGEQVHVYDPDNEVLHTPPPADELAERLETMCDFANGKMPDFFIHPVIRSIILHFWLAYDHPFVDGNGRCARALFYWSMLRQGYWLCEFISISQVIKKAKAWAKYERAFLYTETDDNDLTYFILYHLKLIRQAIGELHSYIQRKNKQMRLTGQLIRRTAGFNHRQRALLSHALRHPHMEYTIQSHEVCHSVVYQTARTDLMDLERKGLLKSQKVGRRMYFTPVGNLEDKLKRLK
jgi:Fic family protein